MKTALHPCKSRLQGGSNFLQKVCFLPQFQTYTVMKCVTFFLFFFSETLPGEVFDFFQLKLWAYQDGVILVINNKARGGSGDLF